MSWGMTAFGAVFAHAFVRDFPAHITDLLLNMKVRYALLAVAALLTPAFAADHTTDPFTGVPALSAKRLSGSLTVGVDTNYVGRGLIISHSVAEGDGSEFAALKLNYDINKKKFWSLDSTIMYKAVSSGHTLYGPKPYNHPIAQYAGIAPKNIENEFAVVNGIRYTTNKTNVALGHKFVHGGLLGAMAKHFRSQGASNVNEVYVSASASPAPWFETGVTVSYSFQGIQGWWFEPYATFKAPIFGEPQKENSMAALLTFGMSATCNYFQNCHNACANGPQAWWIKLATPYFATKSLVITPSVSFNWLGTGGQKANSVAQFKNYPFYMTDCVPFRNFGVVGSLSVSYLF